MNYCYYYERKSSLWASTWITFRWFIGPPGGCLERSGKLPPGGPWLSVFDSKILLFLLPFHEPYFLGKRNQKRRGRDHDQQSTPAAPCPAHSRKPCWPSS